VDDETEIVADFHTHPYDEQEIKNDRKFYKNFDGFGVTFSSDDILEAKRSRKYLKNGHIFLVLAGDVLYGLEITDWDKALKLFKKDVFVSKMDYMNKNMPDEGDYGDLSWGYFLDLINEYGGQEANGIKLHSKKIE
jgi:hypothetical protein